jgi:hypothetical protein
MRSLVLVVPSRVRLRWFGLVAAAVLAIGATALAPAIAAADACTSTDDPSTDDSYTGNCGPSFAVPNWTDAGGWSDPSQYATIQLADVNGDGSDELIGRNDEGMEIFWFDTSVGHWRPQADASGLPQALWRPQPDANGNRPPSDFATPPQSQESDPHNPAQPQYYSTIQAADVDGQSGEEILARFWDGMRVYKYVPPSGKSIDGGTWNRIGTGGPFSDSDGWGDPSRYLTIKAADVDGDGKAELLSRTPTGAAIYGWTGSTWVTDGPQVTDALFGGDCGDVRCYSAFRPYDAIGGADWLLTRPLGGAPANQQGAQMLKRSGSGSAAGWTDALSFPQSPQDLTAAPFNGQSSWPDCSAGGSTECFDVSPSYYDTLQAANIDGVPGDELLGRLEDGLRAKQYLQADFQITDDPDPAMNYVGQWGHATGRAGAMFGTLSGSFGGGTGEVTWQGGPSDKMVRVIGPKGFGLGPITMFAEATDVPGQQSEVSQEADDWVDQQVLFEFSAPSGNPELDMSDSDGPIWIDAILHGPRLDSQWTSLATVGDLAGTSEDWASTPGKWGSIRAGDINGDGKDEVLALDGEALQAWSYNPGANAWTKLQPSKALALDSDPWLTHPEYYSTIRVGDVDGDGRDDVVARGPFGIRTWFYDRRGTGGWERYLAEGYPDFPSRPCPSGVTGPCGQQAAFNALTDLAKPPQNTIIANSLREKWALENAPQPTDLTTFQTGLISIANCTQPPIPGEPPSFKSCTPPGAPTTYSADEWTAVVNEILAENFWALQVVSHFQDLSDVMDSVLITDATKLNAIAAQLQVQAAAGSPTPSQFDGPQLWSIITGIAGALAGLADPVAGVELAVTSYALSAIPSASSTAMSAFPSTYAGLADKFAEMAEQMIEAHDTQSQEVRQDAGLLKLVGELRARETWQIDKIGMESAASQGFATWVYQRLVPTVYDRYEIHNCYNHSVDDDPIDREVVCSGPPAGTGVIGGDRDFVTIAQPYGGEDVTPCTGFVNTGLGQQTKTCTFNLPPSDFLNRIWGPVSEGCTYVPGQSKTKWTYGCSVGVDVSTSLGANTWGFNYHWGYPFPYGPNGRGDNGATAARAGTRAPVVLGRPRLGRRRAVRGRAQFTADVSLPAGLRLAGATLRLDRLLFERRGRGELLRPNGPRLPRRLTLRRASSGRFTATSAKNRRRLRVMVDRRERGRVRLTLAASAPTFRTPRACHALPARVGMRRPKLRLETRLLFNDGDRRVRVPLRHHLRCARDRQGNVDRLVSVRSHRSPQRGGLAVSLRGPRQVEPGSTVRYVARVHNRRRGKRRLASSVWDIMLHNGPRTKRIHELRRGRTRSVVLTRQVPPTARGRVCARVVATAPGTRAASDRVCSLIRAAQAPPAPCASCRRPAGARHKPLAPTEPDGGRPYAAGANGTADTWSRAPGTGAFVDAPSLSPSW